MRVLQINTVSGTTSPGRICTDLARLLISEGHECMVAYGRKKVAKQFQDFSVKIGSDFDVMMHGLRTRIFDDTGFGSKKATTDFVDWLEDYDPDIIHLHNLHGYYLNIEVLFEYLNKANKPVIWTLHDCWSFTGHCAHFDFIECDKWKTSCFQCPEKRSYPASFLFDNSTKNYQRKKQLFTSLKDLTVITPSKWLGDLVKQSFLLKYPVEVIHNGIDLDRFKPRESNFRARYGVEEKIVLLGVASIWTQRKGLDTFFQLANNINDHFVIVLVGLNQDQIKKLPSNIIGIERTESIEELAEIYTAADVLVNPTVEDNFPTVNLEALACGTPVLTYQTGGSPESLDEFTGIIVEKNNYNQLLSVINEEEYIQLSSTDCIAKGEQYSKRTMLAEYMQVYGRRVC